MGFETIFPIIMFSFVIVAWIAIVVWQIRLKRSYVFQYRSHEIIARITSVRSVALYVDGKVEDEIMAQNLRLVTLRAFVEGEEVKIRIRIGLRTEVSASAGNNELPLISITK